MPGALGLVCWSFPLPALVKILSKLIKKSEDTLEKYRGGIVVEMELQEIHECQSETNPTNIGSQLNSVIFIVATFLLTICNHSRFPHTVDWHLLFFPGHKILTLLWNNFGLCLPYDDGTILVRPCQINTVCWRRSFEINCIISISSIISRMRMMMMNKSNQRPILGFSWGKCCCSRLSLG